MPRWSESSTGETWVLICTRVRGNKSLDVDSVTKDRRWDCVQLKNGFARRSSLRSSGVKVSDRSSGLIRLFRGIRRTYC